MSAQSSWEQRVIHRVKSFLGSLFERPDRDAVVGNAGTLPFDLYLSMGMCSFPLFGRGAIDEFRFFQRYAVPGLHDVEFLSRLDPEDQGSENYKAFGILRLYPERAQTLFDQEEVLGLWSTLRREHGLVRAPEAHRMAGAKGFSGFDLRDESSNGANRLSPKKNARVVVRAGRKRMTYAQILEILREEMSPRLKIAWIEDAFPEAPDRGQIAHRYYLTSDKEIFLVRHHWAEGKRLYQAETSEEARRICAASGVFQRARRRAA